MMCLNIRKRGSKKVNEVIPAKSTQTRERYTDRILRFDVPSCVQHNAPFSHAERDDHVQRIDQYRQQADHDD